MYCAFIAVMSVKVATSVALVKPALSSDCSVKLIVGVDVPLTAVQCTAAYTFSPALTAPRLLPVEAPVVVNAPSSCIVPLTTLSAELDLETLNGVISPTEPKIL